MLPLLRIAALTLALFASACSSPSDRAGASPAAARPGAGDEVALQAMSMLGKPYRWGGSSPAAGFDCSGLAWFAWQRGAGVQLPRQAKHMSRIGQTVSRARLLPGDLVFFNTQRRRYSHVGVYVGEGRFVHAPRRGKDIRLAELTNPYWASRYNGARRPSL